MSFLDLRPSPPSAKPDAPVRWSTYSRQPLLMGWPVAVCLALVLLLPGLVGRDPWRGDDAEHFGVILQLLQGGSWLTPTFQSEVWNQSPLYYWVNALIAWPFSLFLSLPDAARIGNLFWVGTTLYALYQAALTTLSNDDARVLPFLALSAPGLMLSAHETQPDLAIMTGYALFSGGQAGSVSKRYHRISAHGTWHWRHPTLWWIVHYPAINQCLTGSVPHQTPAAPEHAHRPHARPTHRFFLVYPCRCLWRTANG